MTLTLTETQKRLQKTNFEALPKPRKNKGVRGQLLELALGIPNSSKLTDLVDGELKSYTKGESVAVTQLRHTLPEIFNKTPFSDYPYDFARIAVSPNVQGLICNSPHIL